MNVSKAIYMLERVLEEAGDIPLVCLTEVDGFLVFGVDVVFDVMELPGTETEPGELVCALMDPTDDDQHLWLEEDFEDEPERKVGLSIVRDDV